ncbi:MAG TPA: hypothetical protein VM865_00565 [Acidobacteriaceae bacterium]|jgi:hypothetical protein|nr:hypothetical protein [Acidobacteriaceae bacterium]
MKRKLLTGIAAALLAASTATAGAQVYLRIGPPPPPRREIVPVAPRPGWVWQPGYHRWDGGRYVWVPGRYMAPPYERARWVPGHWRHGRRGWFWAEGHWAR